MLAGMRLLALGRAKGMAPRTSCINYLKQLRLAWQLYIDDNHDGLPLSECFNTDPAFGNCQNSTASGNRNLRRLQDYIAK